MLYCLVYGMKAKYVAGLDSCGFSSFSVGSGIDILGSLAWQRTSGCSVGVFSLAYSVESKIRSEASIMTAVMRLSL